MSHKAKKPWLLFTLIVTFLGIFLVCTCLVTCKISLLLNHMSERGLSTKVVTKIEVGQTYKYDGDVYIKFIDKKNYVQFIDNAQYKTNDELNEAAKDQEYHKLYPQRMFTIGEVKKVGNSYHLVAHSKMIIEFKDVEHIKDKVIASKEWALPSDYRNVVIDLKKTSDGYVITKSESNIYRSDKKLPSSIDEFLAQYQYKEESLY